MEIKKYVKTVEFDKYIAIDGKEFNSKEECERYEDKLDDATRFDNIDKAYRDYELDDMIPIHYDASFSECSCYRWYKVNNEAEIEDIEEAYDTTIGDYDCFPTYVCVETEDVEYNGEPYCYTLSKLMKLTREFFKNFDILVEFVRK